MNLLYKDLIRFVGVMHGINPDSVETFHELALALAEHIFDTIKQMHTTWLILHPTLNTILVFESKANGAQEKDDVAGAIRTFLKNVEAPMYAHMDEAWAVEHKAGTDISKAPAPSEDPNRMEIVIIQTFSKTEWRSSTFKIERNPDAVLTNREDAPQSTFSEGRFWNLLEERTIQ